MKSEQKKSEQKKLEPKKSELKKSEPKKSELKEKDTKRKRHKKEKRGVKAPPHHHPHRHLRNYEGGMAECRPKKQVFIWIGSQGLCRTKVMEKTNLNHPYLIHITYSILYNVPIIIGLLQHRYTYSKK